MQIIRNLDAIPDALRGGVVSLGKFDGIHPGHVQTIRCVQSRAAKLGVPAIVMTFDPPPVQVLRPNSELRSICTLTRKIELIQTLELDALVILPTTRELLEQSAEAFFFDMFQNKLNAKAIVEGRNFAFGRGQAGNARTLQLLGAETGIETDILASVCRDGHVISSSGIRSLLRDGRIIEANELMLKPYRMTGTVKSGDRRGRTLGFPTANLSDVETVFPKRGLYATVTHIGEKRYASTTHIGPNPTFDVSSDASGERIETFVHDFSGDLYGRTLHVDFYAWLRGSIRFDSAEALVQQMKRDIGKSEDITATATRKTCG